MLDKDRKQPDTVLSYLGHGLHDVFRDQMGATPFRWYRNVGLQPCGAARRRVWTESTRHGCGSGWDYAAGERARSGDCGGCVSGGGGGGRGSLSVANGARGSRWIRDDVRGVGGVRRGNGRGNGGGRGRES